MSKNDPTAAGSVKHLGVVFVNSELPSPDAASSSTPRSPSKVVLMSNEPMRDLKALFEELADVRRSAAEEYPEDAERNLMAAKCLDRLAATCRHVKPEWVKAFNAAEAGLLPIYRPINPAISEVSAGDLDMAQGVDGEIIGFLREAECGWRKGDCGQICRGAGLGADLYKWRREYGGLKIDQAKR